MQESQNKIGWITGASIVIANMIGAGVFTSLGLQLEFVQDPNYILLLWVLGGLMALSGAFSYAELGVYFKRSGGEYNFLSNIYHPILGYLSGWVSITVGFSAPIALAAISVGDYIQIFEKFPLRIFASVIIIIVALVHSFTINNSSRFQVLITFLKIIAIVAFLLFGLTSVDIEKLYAFNQEGVNFSNYSLAVAFVFVCFSYSGWNAAAYVTGEISAFKKNLPKALIFGTLVVTGLYLFVNYVFLKNASYEELVGQIEVGQIVANNIWGVNGGKMISVIIILILISSISGMIWVGSRVTQVLGEDYLIWKRYAKLNKNNVPVRAIWLQAFISIAFVYSGSFEQVLIYSSFIIQLFSLLTVIGLMILRYRNRNEKDSDNYKSPLYPLPQVFFILTSIWVLYFLMLDKPKESIFGILSLLLAAITYFVNRRLSNNMNKE
jgi:APA family basic amino acid/polyamine antiporter